MNEEAGWISMVDLLLLAGIIGAIVIVLGTAKVRSAQDRIKKADDAAQQAVGAAAEAKARHEKKIGEYMIAMEESVRRSASLKAVLDALELPEENPESGIAQLKGAAKRAELAERNSADAVAREEIAAAQAKAAKDALDQAEAEVAQAESEVAQFKTLIEAEQTKSDAIEAERARLDAALAVAKQQTADALNAAQLAVAANGASQGQIVKLGGELARAGEVKKELLGLPGAVGRVVFVVDRSASMDRGGRWEDAKSTIAAWIKHLPVQSCALVMFDSGVQVIPAHLDTDRSAPPNSLELPLNDAALQANMIEQLSTMEPRGATQTGKGLRIAMQFKDLDAIILFTDGAPDPDIRSGGDAAKAVIELAKQWDAGLESRCIHTVGVGDYFNPSMRNFLLGISEATGGAFIGR